MPSMTTTYFPYTTLFRSFILAHVTDGKEDARKPCSVQTVQEIALVLPGIPSLMQVQPPRVVPQEPRIVACGNVVRPQVDRKRTRLDTSHVAITYGGLCLQ